MRKQDRKHVVSKRYKAEVTKVDKKREYEPREALDLVKSTASTKFDETVDIAIRLGVDPRQGDQVVRLGQIATPSLAWSSPMRSRLSAR